MPDDLCGAAYEGHIQQETFWKQLKDIFVLK